MCRGCEVLKQAGSVRAASLLGVHVVSVVLCLEGLVSFLSSVSTGSYNPLTPVLQGALSPGGKDFERHPFRTEYFKAAHSLHIVQLCVSVLIPMYSRKKLL